MAIETPHDYEAEQGVLGAIIHDNSHLPRLRGALEAQHFFSPGHRYIWTAMLAIADRKEGVDEITLKDELFARGRLDLAGGLPYVAELVDLSPVSSNVMAYARIVFDRWKDREISTGAEDLAKSHGRPEALETFMSRVRVVDKTRLVQEGRSAREVAEQVVNDLEAGIPVTRRVPTYSEIDKHLGGFEVGFPNVIAARTGEGKTTLANQIFVRAGLDGVPALYVTLEMKERSLLARAISNLYDVSGDRLMKHPEGLSTRDWDQVVAARGKIGAAPLHFIGDGQRMTMEALEAAVRRYVDDHGVQMVMVDHLRLIDIKARDAREAQESRITRLHQLAAETDTAIVVCVQISREGTERPRLQHLQWSGAIEEESASVILLHAETDQDNQKQPIWNRWDGEGPHLRIYLAKSRDGKTGNFPIAWVPERYRIGEEPNPQPEFEYE